MSIHSNSSLVTVRKRSLTEKCRVGTLKNRADWRLLAFLGDFDTLSISMSFLLVYR